MYMNIWVWCKAEDEDETHHMAVYMADKRNVTEAGGVCLNIFFFLFVYLY